MMIDAVQVSRALNVRLWQLQVTVPAHMREFNRVGVDLPDVQAGARGSIDGSGFAFSCWRTPCS